MNWAFGMFETIKQDLKVKIHEFKNLILTRYSTKLVNAWMPCCSWSLACIELISAGICIVWFGSDIDGILLLSGKTTGFDK